MEAHFRDVFLYTESLPLPCVLLGLPLHSHVPALEGVAHKWWCAELAVELVKMHVSVYKESAS